MKTNETIQLEGVELDIVGFYVHPQEPIRYADGSGHPGNKSDFEIASIINDEGVDVTDEYNDNRDEIIDLVIEQIED